MHILAGIHIWIDMHIDAYKIYIHIYTYTHIDKYKHIYLHTNEVCVHVSCIIEEHSSISAKPTKPPTNQPCSCWLSLCREECKCESSLSLTILLNIFTKWLRISSVLVYKKAGLASLADPWWALGSLDSFHSLGSLHSLGCFHSLGDIFWPRQPLAAL